MNESGFKIKVRKAISDYWWMSLTHHNEAHFIHGWPDLTVIVEGRVTFIELKVLPNKVTRIQAKNLSNIFKT